MPEANQSQSGSTVTRGEEMASREHWYGLRAAIFYGSERVRWNRAERVAFCRSEIARFENSKDIEDLAQLQFVKSLIRQEQQDELYARHARNHGVDYEIHVSDVCRYWQNLRHRKFVSAGRICERCHQGPSAALDAHHLHYNTLGFEELEDIQALCRRCHSALHNKRRS